MKKLLQDGDEHDGEPAGYDIPVDHELGLFMARHVHDGKLPSTHRGLMTRTSYQPSSPVSLLLRFFTNVAAAQPLPKTTTRVRSRPSTCMGSAVEQRLVVARCLPSCQCACRHDTMKLLSMQRLLPDLIQLQADIGEVWHGNKGRPRAPAPQSATKHNYSRTHRTRSCTRTHLLLVTIDSHVNCSVLKH
jgi:hypothetical protein